MDNKPDSQTEADMIKPAHYKAGSFDVIAFCQEHDVNFALGSAIKYLVRAGKKPGVPKHIDIKKAIEFADRELKHELKTKEG